MQGKRYDDHSAEPSYTTNTGLIDRVRKHDAAAWRRFCALYEPLLRYWLLGFGLRDGDDDDIVQSVFLAVFEHIETFRRDRPGDTFRGWLYTITANKAKDVLKGRPLGCEGAGGSDAYQRLVDLPDALSGAGMSNPATETQLLVHRAVAMIRAEFESRTWQAFHDTAVLGRQPKDVAADLGMSVGAVYKHRSRVLNRLRKELADWYDISAAAARE